MMRKLITLILIVGFCFGAMAQQKQNTISEIKEVTVFTNKAQITREARTSLKKGNTELVFTGLSAQIDPNSIQVKVKGVLIILGIRHERNYLTNLDEPKQVKVLKDSLAYYKSQINEQEVFKSIYKKEEALLASNQVISGKERGITVGELKAMADFYSGRLLQLTRKEKTANQKILSHSKRQKAIQKQLTEWNAYYKKNTSSIIVEVSASKAGNANLIVSYVVYNASWHPTYDLRSTGTDQPIELNYKANIIQSTGVNWEDVKLTLSTANPNLSNVKPSVTPWLLDFERPMLYENKTMSRSQTIKKEKAGQFSVADAESEMLEEIVTVADYTQTTQTTLNTKFDISIPYTVRTGGKATKVDIKKEILEASYTYAVAPKLDNSAFLIAKLTNWDQYDLLAGQANLFFEGTYVGKTFIDTNNVRDTLELSLGRDKHIVVERKPVKNFTSKKLIGSNQKEAYAYEISVRNTKNIPVSILIEDQIPVSSHSDIEVSEVSAEGATWDKSTGMLKWKVKLNAGEDKKVNYSFEVKYPKNKQVMGL
jgi:uncharacterized protein (TIGR02231 family)